MKHIDMDVVVIGGGAAGLGAAVRAKEAGARKVGIIERAEQLGGVLTQCIHNGFGLAYFGQDMSGPEYIHRFITRVNELDIETFMESMVLSITPDRVVTAVSRNTGLFSVKAGAIVLSMGCRERTRGNLVIPGTRPAGVLTAGTAQRLVNIEGYIPGRRTVIIGSGDIGMIMARRLYLEGGRVEGVVEIMPYCSGLIRNENQCLIDFGIPLYLSHATVRIHGNDRVEGVTITPIDSEMNIIPGIEKYIPCDTVLLAVGLIPENEISKSAGIVLDGVTKGPVVNEKMETGVPGIFAAGNVVQVYDLVDYVTMAGEAAAESAVDFSQGKRFENKYRITAGNNVTAIGPQWTTGESDFQIRMRVRRPIKKAEIRINGQKLKRVLGTRPSEMMSVDVKQEQLESILNKDKELQVEVLDVS